MIVLAIGGNSLIKDEAHRTVCDQWALTRETCRHIAPILQHERRVVITHGNGPQVGFILRRSELARHELHEVPLDSCGADTQGAIGYMIQQALANELARRGMSRTVVSIVTRVEVDTTNPASLIPSKPIGSFMDGATAQIRARANGWMVAEDSGRGWRRLVPSPPPIAIVELDAVRTLLDAGHIVIAAGGGGIPVVRDDTGMYRGIEAVIDKDEASTLLATALDADLLVISTSVDRVCVEFGKRNERPLDRVTLSEARRYLSEGQFGAGSMAPKIHAVIRYLEGGGRRAVITSPEKLEAAVAGNAGTTIIPDV